ncbi:ISL3 family transposase [Streptomyces sp. NPDC056653]|uniref:ISL3 family transposase n=1 Tax=Streptomyces sp. NPDC056653 TaxID=3345894 RepID=UPI0036993D31
MCGNVPAGHLSAVGVCSLEDVLFPEIDVRLERVDFTADVLVVVAVACGPAPRCPGCRARARRIYSSYERGLAERPLTGKRMRVRLRVRWFFCDRASCRRLTFVEKVSGLSERYRRSSLGLKKWLHAVAVELGGRPGERLCRKMHLAAGRSRLLELLESPPVPERAPRVLGVDEFAFRKGCTYGTVLVDVEAGQVVDVLPDRTSETFADWLRDHSGVEVICRDRSSAYARAVKEAAPHALEVADRWHLLQNLAAAVEKTCHQHRACLRKHDDEKTGSTPAAPPLMELPLHELPRTQIIERTRHRHADVQRLVAAGWTISAIARRPTPEPRPARPCGVSATPTSSSSWPPPTNAARPECWSRSSRTSTPDSLRARARSAAAASS